MVLLFFCLRGAGMGSEFGRVFTEVFWNFVSARLVGSKQSFL